MARVQLCGQVCARVQGLGGAVSPERHVGPHELVLGVPRGVGGVRVSQLHRLQVVAWNRGCYVMLKHKGIPTTN